MLSVQYKREFIKTEVVLTKLDFSGLKKILYLSSSGTCEVGIVSPIYGMLDLKSTLPKGPNSGHIMTGCLGNCEFIKLF